ncbi:hypothetical protein BHECKSOX_382 [Bathymodiolus heckerae thiotrophic gill symbiont]|uniref:ParB/RepB/Spo0J family partition protein n=1 Tax=Bathymodiolus heckerae thiotrophic gill symbiont TaxID=1052212 RepID=UPI0010B8364E|nr:ParB/RepB/Spo0J family partition protein [Bathymodiolus heckerae thiotrophic gill symbiont]SHN92229.1 hypothetical protein BHECKSOX_382 [Bathymodiolus heckerae thiotrophic gill symbiont]
MVESKGVDLSGLDNFNVSSLISGKQSNNKEGLLSYAPIDKFIEDKNNARKQYSSNELEELINSIKVISDKTGKMTGIKQPLSVQKHPVKEGYFIINGGSRRYRAGKIAGLKQLPYFISDNDAYDNVVDNLIRDGLKIEEIALFISERLKAGDKQGQIAKRLGKPKSYVSDYSIFYDLPSSIKKLFNNGFCNSIQALALLHRNHKKYENEINIFCSSADKNISTRVIREFIEELKKSNNENQPPTIKEKESEDKNIEESTNSLKEKVNIKKDFDPVTNENDKFTKKNNKDLVFLIEFEGSEGKLVFKNTLEYGKVIIKIEGNEAIEVDANLVNILSIEEE